jgi:deoxyhypusine synthase
VDCIVTSAGGIEEDIIKCLGHTYLGSFTLNGEQLRKKGLNRIGNLVIPNDNYCKFEDWVLPVLDEMLLEQREKVSSRLEYDRSCWMLTIRWLYREPIGRPPRLSIVLGRESTIQRVSITGLGR